MLAQHQVLLPGAIQSGAVHVDLKPIASGFTAPVLAIPAPGDSNDLFVVDQTGKISVLHNGVMQPTPLLDLSSIENAVPLNPG